MQEYTQMNIIKVDLDPCIIHQMTDTGYYVNNVSTQRIDFIPFPINSQRLLYYQTLVSEYYKLKMYEWMNTANSYQTLLNQLQQNIQISRQQFEFKKKTKMMNKAYNKLNCILEQKKIKNSLPDTIKLPKYLDQYYDESIFFGGDGYDEEEENKTNENIETSSNLHQEPYSIPIDEEEEKKNNL